MRIDWYTKGLLTVIALLLGVIALRPYISPNVVAHADGSFAGVQFSGSGFFDSRTGDIWGYYDGDHPTHTRVAKLGAPLVKVK